MAEPVTPALVDSLLAETGFLSALARHLARDAHAADDLVQDTFVAALEGPPRGSESPHGLRGWLATVLRNRSLKQARESAARRRREEVAARAESFESSHDDTEARVLLHRRLADAILALDEPYRSAVTLRWLEGHSPREVARIQGITYEAARQRLSRAVAMLRAKLDNDCGGRASWSALVLALPRHAASSAREPALPSPIPFLPEVLAVSTLTKVVGAAVVVVAVCMWLVIASGGDDPLSPPPVVEPSAATRDRQHPQSDPFSPTSSTQERAPLAADLATNATPADAERVLSGIVLDPQGEPVANARVDARHSVHAGYGSLDLTVKAAEVSMARAITGKDGRFRLDIEPGRPFVLEVEAPPFARARLSYRYAGEEVIVRLVHGAVLAGQVLRKLDGAPVAGASVRMWHRPGDVRGGAVRDSKQFDLGTTDAGGRFRAEGLPAIGVFVDVTPIEDSPPLWHKVDLVAGTVTNLDIRVETGPTLVGTVIDARTKQPIAGAEVGENWVMNRSVRTNALGEYVLKGFPVDGVFDIGLRAKGYGYKTVPVRSGREAPFPERLDVELSSARKARGRVVDARGAPVAGAYVAGIASDFAEDQRIDWIGTKSATDGTFAIDDLRPDIQHAVHVRREGFGTVTYEFPPNELQLDVVELGDVVLQDMASVRGRVLTTGGEPVADQLVEIRGWNADRLKSGAEKQGDLDSYIGERQARTDHAGRFVFSDLAAGSYSLETRVSGVNQPVTRPLEVETAARLTDQDLVIEPGLAIAGRIVGPDGEPVTNCYVSIDAAGGGATTNADVQTDDKGRFRAIGLTPGDYKLSTWHYVPSDQRDVRKKYAHKDVVPVAAGNENVLIDLEIAHFLRGRVLDARGEPVPRALVIAKSTRAGFEEMHPVVDAVGCFEIELPEDLEVELFAGPRVEGDGEPDPSRMTRKSGLKAGAERVEIRLPVTVGGG